MYERRSPKLIYGPLLTSILCTYPSQTSTLLDHHLLRWRSIGRSNALNGLYILLSFDHFTKHGVLAVKVRGWNGGDEELGSIPTSNFNFSMTRIRSWERVGAALGLTHVLGPEFAIESR